MISGFRNPAVKMRQPLTHRNRRSDPASHHSQLSVAAKESREVRGRELGNDHVHAESSSPSQSFYPDDLSRKMAEEPSSAEPSSFSKLGQMFQRGLRNLNGLADYSADVGHIPVGLNGSSLLNLEQKFTCFSQTVRDKAEAVMEQVRHAVHDTPEAAAETAGGKF